MAILDGTALAQVLKIQYTQRKVNNICYSESSLLARIARPTNWGGQVEHVAFQYGSPQGRGAAFAVAQGNITPSVYDGVNVPRARDYAFAEITGEMIDAAKENGSYALLDGLKREIDNAFYTVARSIAAALFGAGGGARGKIGATTTLASPTLVLDDPNSVVNFEVGMVLNLGATDGTTGAKRAGTLTIVGINRDTGTLTVNANISTVTGAALGDFVFQNGDFETTRSMLTGLAGWIPWTAPVPGDNFFGLDRSKDVTRLSGVRFDGQGGPIEETIVKAAAKLSFNGGKGDLCVMNTLDFANLIVALGSKVIIENKQLPDADIGITAVKIHGPKGPIDVITDANCPTGFFYLLTSSTWRFKTILGAPRILGETGDGLKLLRSPTSDSYQIRLGYYGNLLCDAPGWNLVGKL